jgi:hypothetical protein
MRFLPRLFIGVAVSSAPVAAIAAPSSCNPIEALFGGCHQSAEPAVRPSARAHTRPTFRSHASSHGHGSSIRYATVHAKRKPAKEGATRDQRQTPLAPPPGVAFASVEHFAADPTLRSGDVVVTTKGFLVYRDNETFRPLDRKRALLASLEKASRAPAAATWQSRSPLADWSPAVSSQLTGADGVRSVSFSASAYRYPGVLRQ